MPDMTRTDHAADVCFECGEPAEHMHHVVPRSLGGTKTLPLCKRCHKIVHSEGSNLSTAALAAASKSATDRVSEEVDALKLEIENAKDDLEVALSRGSNAWRKKKRAQIDDLLDRVGRLRNERDSLIDEMRGISTEAVHINRSTSRYIEEQQRHITELLVVISDIGRALGLVDGRVAHLDTHGLVEKIRADAGRMICPYCGRVIRKAFLRDEIRNGDEYRCVCGLYIGKLTIEAIELHGRKEDGTYA